jgi:hypothetical protein
MEFAGANGHRAMIWIKKPSGEVSASSGRRTWP